MFMILNVHSAPLLMRTHMPWLIQKLPIKNPLRPHIFSALNGFEFMYIKVCIYSFYLRQA